MKVLGQRLDHPVVAIERVRPAKQQQERSRIRFLRGLVDEMQLDPVDADLEIWQARSSPPLPAANRSH
nr:hypothetical protein [Mesorhizobium sp.]